MFPNERQPIAKMAETSLNFGERGELFGVFHAADGGGPVVVFCAPFAEEKKCSYRTFVETARALAAAGVPGFRFDYFGTGDSDGAFSEFTPSRAIEDIVAASAKARELAGTETLALLGLRLGGTLALSAAPRVSAERVILWQPVLDAAGFFDLTIKRQMLRKQLIAASGSDEKRSSDRADGHMPGPDVIDLDGFPLSRAAGEEIRGLDGARSAESYPGPIHLLQISHTESLSRQHARLAAGLGDRLTTAAVKCQPFWNRIDLADTTPVIEQTVDWLK